MLLFPVAICPRALDREYTGEDLAGVGFLGARNEFGRALGDNAAAAFATFGT